MFGYQVMEPGVLVPGVCFLLGLFWLLLRFEFGILLLGAVLLSYADLLMQIGKMLLLSKVFGFQCSYLKMKVLVRILSLFWYIWLLNLK